MRRRDQVAILAGFTAIMFLCTSCGLKGMFDYGPRKKLFKAVEERDERRVRELLDNGLDVNTETYLSKRALTQAALQDDPSMVRVLLEYGATVDDNLGELALRFATHHGSPESVRLMLAAGADPNGDYYLGGSILMNAAEPNNLDSAKLLLEFGADPNQRGRYEGSVTIEPCEATPLMLAARNGNRVLVELLLDAGANPAYEDEFGCSARDAADKAGHTELVGLLDEIPTINGAPSN